MNVTRREDRLKEEMAENVMNLKIVQGTMEECQATVEQLEVRVVHEQAVSGNKSALGRKLEKVINSQLATLSDNVKSLENSQLTLEEMKRNEEHLEQSLLQMKKNCEASELKAMFAADEAKEIVVRMQEEHLAELEQSRSMCEKNISTERSLSAIQERTHLDMLRQAEEKSGMQEKQHELRVKKLLFYLQGKGQEARGEAEESRDVLINL